MDNENKEQIKPENYWLEFKSLWEKTWFDKQSEIKDDIQKYVWFQMNVFFSGALMIHQINCCNGDGNTIKHENLSSTLIFRNISVPTLRLLMESYFRVMYLCFSDNKEIQAKRFEKILSKIGHEYNKFSKEIKDHPEFFDFLIQALPESAKIISGKQLHVESILKELSTSGETDLSFLYGVYRIACFYAHGNIDNVTWKIIFDKNDILYTLPIDSFKVISIISKTYLHIARYAWGA